MKAIKTTMIGIQFEYKGNLYTSFKKMEKYNAYELLRQTTESEELNEINKTFNWDEFYKKAKENNCGEVDVFLVNGLKVVPCDTMKLLSTLSPLN